MKRLFCIFALVIASLAMVAQANVEIPRPEHPRPDAYRENWMNLNGQWQFEIDNDNTGLDRGLVSGKDLNDKILVPFCPESKLSGIENRDHMKYVWYRRHFVLPNKMEGKRVLLHFGAVDYKAWVYVNGAMVGTHRGSNAAFSFDVTEELVDGQNEIVVRVFDDTRSGLQPTGKQAHGQSEGPVYTRTTGIWQTVWLEAVSDSYIKLFSIVPDISAKRAIIDVTVDTVKSNLKLKAVATFNGKVMAKETVDALWRDNKIVLDLKKLYLWEVGNPNLYDLELTLYDGFKAIDSVKSYFGMRSVKINGRSILINGKRVFQRLILDQGFYPDGLWTAPSDQDLKDDIKLSMEAGYNGARLHQKVFEPRFLYWADKMGYLCWGEYTSWGFNCESEGYAAYIDEWTEILLRDRNHPSIIGWCPFNESMAKGADLQRTIFYLTQAVDPTRPIYETSGWAHTMLDVDMRDIHDYDQNPETLHKRWMDFFAAKNLPIPTRYGSESADLGVPFMVSEFGGIGWSLNAGWGYGSAPKTLEEFYTRYSGICKALLDNSDMYGFCYTQLTDIEQEQNGLYYYDRSNKFDIKRIYEGTQQEAAYEKVGPQTPLKSNKKYDWKVLVGASVDGSKCRPFQYTTDKPDDSWVEPSFDDSSWKSGYPPFGSNGRTNWRTNDIWLRQEFKCNDADFKTAVIVIFYDEDTEVFVNGKKIFAVSGFSLAFDVFEITEALKGALKQGENTIAIHTHQRGGGQRIDAAILID